MKGPEARRSIEECIASAVSRTFQIAATTRHGRSFGAEGRIEPLFGGSEGFVVGAQVVLHETTCRDAPGRGPSLILRDRTRSSHARCAGSRTLSGEERRAAADQQR